MKNILLKLLTLVCILSLCLGGLIACEDNHTHRFDRQIIHNDSLKAEATCLESAKYFYSCKCGAIGTEIFEHGLPKGHNYVDYVSNGDCTHSRICSRDNSHIVINDCYASSENSATCSKKAVCNYCNTEFGEIVRHSFGSENKCIWCDIETYSQGLEYTLNGNEYEVSGIGDCTDKNIIIPNCYDGKPVTRIGDRAFENCTSLESVAIPNTATSIGDRAFYFCESLTSIEIPDSVEAIGDDVFAYCTSLKSIEIPNGVEKIGEYAFYKCYLLTSIVIPDSIASIGYYAFAHCTSFESIEIPDSVTSIYGGAFAFCASLKSIEIPDSVPSISDEMFAFCDSLTNVVIGNGVETIGVSAFTTCSSLTSIVIPNSVESIGDWAFCDCISLTSVIMGNSVTSIGNRAFQDCNSLASIVIPEKLSNIGYEAFRNNTSLANISFNGTVSGWGNISKGSNWNSFVPATFVQCSDGKADI